MRLTGSGVLAVAGLAAGALLLVVLWRYREKFNPLDERNLAHQGAGAVVAAATGGRETTVGGLAASVREWWSGDDARIEAMKAGAPPVAKSNAKTALAPANNLDAELTAGYNERVPAGSGEGEFLSP